MSTLSANVSKVVDKISLMETSSLAGQPQQPQQQQQQHTQQLPAGPALTPKSKELTGYFEIPETGSTQLERQLFFVQTKLSLEQPITQERNRHEAAAIFRVVRTLLDGPLDNTARKAIAQLLVRAKELLLMESSGVKFATTFANHINYNAESSIISSAHNAALLADRKSNRSSGNTKTAKKKRTRPTKEADDSKASASKRT